jgi:type IV pilus assembly protein PilC
MFEKLAHNYEEGLNHNISIINTLIEPMIIIFLGGIIGFILIAMYLPLFNMGNQMVM